MHRQRKYSLRIWWLGLGFYIFYTPYSGLTKALSSGFLPGMDGPVSGIVILPVSAIATCLGMLSFITIMGWWKYAGRRNVLGISIPFPRIQTFLSGVCMAIIMGTTTLAFSFGGLSIVLMLVLLRGGTLIIAPVVDGIVGRRVRWFSWAAMFVSLLAVSLALSDVGHYELSIAAAIDVAAYLAAYFFKLQFMSRLAKSDEKNATLRYFVEEQMIASPLLTLVLVVLALAGTGNVTMGFRIGLTTFLNSQWAIFAALVGLFYAALCICTTLIFLDRRENTFCMPLHCGSSMLSGFTASAFLSYLFNLNSISTSQMISAGFIVIALGFLSPLHHFDRSIKKLKNAVTNLRSKFIAPFSPIKLPTSIESTINVAPRLILFVCSGNTCRSPMAAAIAKMELVGRLGIPIEAIESAPVKVTSAGLSARVGEPMTAEAKLALRELAFHPNGHKAQNMTFELAQKADNIFCMTLAHQTTLIKLFPETASKTQLLDPNGDVEDPLGGDLPAYINCAQRIHSSVRLRLDEINLQLRVV